MAKRGNPGLQGRLLDKSIEAYVLALETINRLSIKYRVEAFTYLICNAWELLLKSKIIQDAANRQAIYETAKRGLPRRTHSLRHCLASQFLDENHPVRRNVEMIAALRDECVHLVMSTVPKDVLGLFQASVLSYHKHLVEWFGVSLSDRVSVGMMTIVYDFAPDELDLGNAKLVRQLGRDTTQYLSSFSASIRDEVEKLGHHRDFAIDISYKLVLTKNPAEGDITINAGPGGDVLGILEVPKDPAKTHPYRRKEVIARLNEQLGGTEVNQYDIQCVVNAFDIKKRPEFFYQGGVKGSPGQYSDKFAAWIVAQHKKNAQFFVTCRQKGRKEQA